MTEEGFKTLIAAYADDMWRMAYSVLHDSDEASDAVQDVFVRLWERRREISDSRNLRAYCLSALHHRCVDSLRRNRIRQSAPLDSCREIPDADSAPDDILERGEDMTSVKSMILTLSENQQTVIRLSAFGGCSNDEISSITGLSAENVRTLLSRGRKKLRELFNRQNRPIR